VSKRRRRRCREQDQGGGDDPKLLGAIWREMMREDMENLPSLVWRRVVATRRIDLADTRQASDLQVYLVLKELMESTGGIGSGPDAEIRVEVIDLESLVDTAVTRAFR
jgi:hypothetical protein